MRIRVRSVVVLLMSWGLSSAPLGARQQPPPPAEEVEHEALRQLRTMYMEAIRGGRLDALAPHLASDFHGVMVTGRVVKSFADLKTYWSDIQALIGAGGTYTTTLNPERSVIIGDVALARGTSDDVVVTSEGREFRFTSYWTATLQKENGAWKILQMQGSIDPVDNVFVRAFTRRALLLTGALSGGAGIILGAGLAVLIRRRRPRA